MQPRGELFAVNNSAARGFYIGLGFEAVGQIRNYYQGNLDAIVMEKTLVPSAALIP